uniref:Uncharacterized protein n=1 Tax=Cyanistes caeruleus TaxID=156563 RepID=A0A8C0TX54_CYACU
PHLHVSPFQLKAMNIEPPAFGAGGGNKTSKKMIHLLLPASSRCSPAFEDSIRVWTLPSKASAG